MGTAHEVYMRTSEGHIGHARRGMHTSDGRECSSVFQRSVHKCNAFWDGMCQQEWMYSEIHMSALNCIITAGKAVNEGHRLGKF